MEIVRVEATVHDVPLKMPLGAEWPETVVAVKISTADGLDGYAFSELGSPGAAFAVREMVEKDYSPLVIGEDATATERLWHKCFWALNARVRTGVVSQAASLVDMALWDIKSQAAGMPLHRLLGGGQDVVDVYASVHGPDYSPSELGEIARQKVESGHRTIKIGVARRGPSDIDLDVRRVKAVRDAIGDDIGLAIDANCMLGLQDALKLVQKVEQFDIAWFEEPITNNEPTLAKQLRSRTSIPISAGQAEAYRWGFRDLIADGSAYDLIQVDLAYVGGYTEALKAAALTQSMHLGVTTHGSPMQNMHFVGGTANGQAVEFHLIPEGVDRQFFTDFLEPVDGRLTLPTVAGRGVQLDQDFFEYSKIK